ncbi:MAG: bifunctional hydroxymethylpyrimidine kinase/phosphomethylpyrimidine kinase [Candidatus Aminicenantes bacterium]|nr:bifunctional hydroxymethylpyrimidine kinase/phosphomethylpyrimidine kinase [Candidatus Aminicenantes bacterium]
MIPRKRLDELLTAFSDRHVLVAGDLILDRYLFGRVERISPEAPVPVLHVQREEIRPGGAGNVAANIIALGASVQLLGVLGHDESGRAFRTLMPDQDLVISDPGYSTITKTRVLSFRQQIVRIDHELPAACISPLAMKQLSAGLKAVSTDAVLVSDYAKGTVTSSLMRNLHKLASISGIPLVVDPKPANAHLYNGVTGITPNLTESEKLLGEPIHNPEKAARLLQRRFSCRFAMITRGEEGITAAEHRRQCFHIPAWAHEVYDVTGAGDTVTAVLVLALSSGAALREAVILANAAASLVVEKVGTATVSPGELRQRILDHSQSTIR